MVKRRKDGKIDLRYVDMNDPEVRTELSEEIKTYGIEVRGINKRGEIGLKMHATDVDGDELKAVRPLKEYVGEIRKIEKMEKRVNRLRESLGIKAYETRALNTLIREDSSKFEGITGTQNYIATLKKILTKDPVSGRNKIQEAYANRADLEQAKITALGGVEAVSKIGSIDVSKYQTKTGKFKSKKLERQMFRDLANVVQDENYIESPELFYPWLSKNNISIKGADKATIAELYKDYLGQSLEHSLVAKRMGAKEADKMMITEEEIVVRLKAMGIYKETPYDNVGLSDEDDDEWEE